MNTKANKKPQRPGNSHGRPETQVNLSQPLPQGEPFLPHERDQAPDAQPPDGEETKGPREVIRQAQDDVNRGLRDTDLHGTPSDVPGPPIVRESDHVPGRKRRKGEAGD
jgi:hypothetical protein